MLRSVGFLAQWCCALLLVITAISCKSSGPNIKVQFIDSRVGWIVGPRLLATTDGGRTWRSLRSEGFGTFDAEYIGYGHRSIQFIDSKMGFQLGGNSLAKTTNGGDTWDEHLSIPKPNGQEIPPQSLFFVSPDVGWVVGENIYRTTDGGRTWTLLCKTPTGDHQRQRAMRVGPSYADYMPSIWFADLENGLMARLDGEIHATRDGGKSWTLALRVDKSITDMYFINTQKGWVVGDDGFMANTNDGGKTWTLASSFTNADLTSVFFLNNDLGWIAGVDSTILYTRDGGATWHKASVAGEVGSTPLGSISFSDSMHGWAVGGNADPMYPSLWAPSNLVLSSDDGGQNWTAFKP